MTYWQALILGLIQGLTEFLPVSSSGHLLLAPRLFGFSDPGLAFDAVLHAATLAAVLCALGPEIWRVLNGLLNFRRDPWGQLGWKIILATLPAVIVGLVLKDFIAGALRQTWVVIISLFFWGAVLYWLDRRVSQKAEAKVESVSWRSAFGIGLAQALALIPGTSRSGITISAGLFAGLSRTAAAKFSFLLGIPAIAGAALLATLDWQARSEAVAFGPLAAAFLMAFASGFWAIRWLVKLMSRGNYRIFAYYRFALAGLLFLFLALGLIT